MTAVVERRTMQGWIVKHRLDCPLTTEDVAKINEACKPDWRVRKS